MMNLSTTATREIVLVLRTPDDDVVEAVAVGITNTEDGIAENEVILVTLNGGRCRLKRCIAEIHMHAAKPLIGAFPTHFADE